MTDNITTGATTLNEHALAIRTLGKRVVADVIQIGRHLIEAKALAGYGNWLPWLEREFGWSTTTAEGFMSVAVLANTYKFPEFGNLDISALYLLAAQPKSAAPVVAEVIDRARAGEVMPLATVREIVTQRRSGGEEQARNNRNDQYRGSVAPAASVAAPAAIRVVPVQSAPVEMLALKTHLGETVLYKKPQSKATFNPTNEAVSWADWTWNPVTGCLHGCKYCYAREISTRFPDAFPAGFEPLFHKERLDAPRNTKVPEGTAARPQKKRVFVCSMADLYGKWVPDEWIEQVHASCIDNPQWDYLMLTKFPRRYVGLNLPKTAWLGTTVDEQKRVRLAEEAFRQIDNVRVKWLSLEPLLAPLEFSDLSMFDWVVIGAQTATNQPDGAVKEFAPPFEWVAKIVAQAREADCRVYLKENLLGIPGPNSPGMVLPQEEPDVMKVQPKFELVG